MCPQYWLILALLLGQRVSNSQAWTTAPMSGSSSRCHTRVRSLHVFSDRVASNPFSYKHSAVILSVQSSAVDVEEIIPPAESEVKILEPEAPSGLENMTLAQKIINAIILAVSFGYAAYTILNIDHGMTRGWTQSEIAMRIPLDNWNSYEASLSEKPIYTKTLINVVIYLLGDWLSQTVFQGKNILDFDAKRTMRNGFIGLCFGPLVHEYYQFSDHILPVEGGIWNRIEKILMDQTVYLTIKCSAYIAAVGLLQGDDVETVKTSVKDKIGGIVVTAWKFWPLVHCITYGVIPARHRILWVNSVDLIWNAILASMSQKNQDDQEEGTAAVDENEKLLLEKSKISYDASLEDEHESASSSHPSTTDPFLLKQEILPAATLPLVDTPSSADFFEAPATIPPTNDTTSEFKVGNSTLEFAS